MRVFIFVSYYIVSYGCRKGGCVCVFIQLKTETDKKLMKKRCDGQKQR
jgi:hypothetical protein